MGRLLRWRTVFQELWMVVMTVGGIEDSMVVAAGRIVVATDVVSSIVVVEKASTDVVSDSSGRRGRERDGGRGGN